MASTYLTRTLSTGVNRRTFTFSAWIKRARINAYDIIFEVSNGSHIFQIATNPTGDGDCIKFYDYTGTTNLDIKTNQAFRDLSAWYHIVIAVDTTQATNTNRAKLYVNGEQVTSLAISTYPSQNYDTALNNSVPMQIGRQLTTSYYYNGSMAHVNFTDGTAYDASYFGQTDSLTGIWKPITSPSVTYGTNGFFLKFANSGSMGTDSSGNSNNFTVNGNLTQTQDTPSNVFATMNALDNSSVTLSNGNLTCSCASPSRIRSTFGATAGKYYAEVKYQSTTSFCGVGPLETPLTSTAILAILFGQSGGFPPEFYLNGSYTSDYNSAGAFSANDIMQIALDMDSNTVYFGKNGSWFGGTSWTESTPTTGHSLTSGYTYGFVATTGSGTSVNIWNFGNGYFGTTAVASAGTNASGIGIFEYDVPTGYTALSTKGLNL